MVKTAIIKVENIEIAVTKVNDNDYISITDMTYQNMLNNVILYIQKDNKEDK